MTLWLASRRVRACLAVALLVIAIVLIIGSVTVSVPSLVSSGLPLPIAAVAPLAIAITISWALTTSDATIESGAVRPVNALEAILVGSLSVATAVILVVGAVVGSSDAAAIAARGVVGYVGMMAMARAVVRPDVIGVVPVAYVIVVAFFAGATSANAPLWAWVIRPPDDPSTWMVALVLLGVGCVILASGRHGCQASGGA